MRFEGKRILVTGGARGIGAATALAFRAEGAVVAIGARSNESYAAFVDRHGPSGFVPAVGLLGSRDSCFAVVGAAIDAFGGLDILINSAGYFAEVPIEAIDQVHWDVTMQTNLAGTFFCSQAALPALTAARSGSIVNVASDAGLIGYPNGTAYSASKGAVVNLTRAMALELARRVRVNCVCPGNVDTEMIQAAAEASGNPEEYLSAAHRRSPLRRMAQPEEVAAAILYLSSDQAAFVNGAIMPIDGGGVCGF